jgi:hypothetical protein
VGMAAQAPIDTRDDSGGERGYGCNALSGDAATHANALSATDPDGARASAFPCATTDCLAAVLFAEGAAHPAAPARVGTHTYAHAAARPHPSLSTGDTSTRTRASTGSASRSCPCTNTSSPCAYHGHSSHIFRGPCRSSRGRKHEHTFTAAPHPQRGDRKSGTTGTHGTGCHLLHGLRCAPCQQASQR